METSGVVFISGLFNQAVYHPEKNALLEHKALKSQQEEGKAIFEDLC